MAPRGGVSLGSKEFLCVREENGIRVTNEKARKSRRVMSIRISVVTLVTRKVLWSVWVGIRLVVVWAYQMECCNEGVLCVWRCNSVVGVCMWILVVLFGGASIIALLRFLWPVFRFVFTM
jgi:hypothetical protein